MKCIQHAPEHRCIQISCSMSHNDKKYGYCFGYIDYFYSSLAFLTNIHLFHKSSSLENLSFYNIKISLLYYTQQTDETKAQLVESMACDKIKDTFFEIKIQGAVMAKTVKVVAAIIKGVGENKNKIFATQRGYGDFYR